jgi:hypothetical protein
MSKRKLAEIIGVCILAIIIIVVITMLSPTPMSEPVLVTHNCTDHTTTSIEAQGEVTDDGGTITRRGFYYGTGLLYGLEFDGIDDQVVLPAGSQPTGAFTLAIWCKPTSWDYAAYPGLFGGVGLQSYEGGGLSGIAITRYYDATTATDKLVFDVADGTNAARRKIAPLITKIAPPGKWSFIVLTNSGVAEPGGLKLYRNSAIPVGNTTGAASVRWSENQTTLGNSGWYSKGYFKGIIGEVRIYDRALNTAEITALYNGQDVTGSLRGYWKLDEGSGDTAYDSSGNDNNGSLEGAPERVLADWDLTDEGDIVYETGNFRTGTYSLNITGLEPDTWYRIMAFAENEAGIGYGNIVTCKTLE